MNLPRLLISRPVALTLILIAITVIGAICHIAMPVSDLPQVEYPTLQVTARLPGADPQTMAAAVATPLERQFSSLSGIESMTSVSGTEVTTITLRFSLDRPIDAAGLDVQAALTRAARQLPPDMPGPPTFREVDPGDLPVIYLGLTSKNLPMSELTRQAESIVAQELSAIEGVALVNVYGAQKYAVRIDVSPGRLMASGIGLNSLIDAASRANANVPAGTVHGENRTMAVSVDDRLRSAEDFARLVVGGSAEAPVRLSDVARVRDGVQNEHLGAWINGRQGLLIAVDKQVGANVIEVVEEIHRRLPSIRDRMSSGAELSVFYDRTYAIQDSIADVTHTMWIAIGLVVVVVAMFLRRVRAAAIPAIALPLSLAGAITALYLSGGGINMFSMLALTLAVGFVVDDAIVVLERISRRMEQGEDPSAAASGGAGDMAATVVAMTISLAIVFVPFLFLDSIIGRLLKEFAIAIIAAVCVSGAVALMITPALCARLLPRGGVAAETAGEAERFSRLRDLYLRLLRRSLAHPWLVSAAIVVIGTAAAAGIAVAPKGFLPNNDTGQLSVYAEATEDIGFEAMSTKLESAARLIREDPDVASVETFFGIGGGSPTMNVGRMIVALKPASERDSANVIVDRIRPRLEDMVGMTVYLQSVPTLRLGLSSRTQHQYVLRSSDVDTLYREAPRVIEAIRKVPGVRDVDADALQTMPRLRVSIDRAAAAALRVDAVEIKRALNAAFGPRQVSTIYGDLDQYAVLMRFEDVDVDSGAMLSSLHVTSSDGSLVPLSAVAAIEAGVGPLQVTHMGQFPSVVIAFDIEPDFALGPALDNIRDEVAKLRLPDAMKGEFQGNAQAFESASADIVLLFAAALLLIYLILGIQYESYTLPLVVIAVLPTAAFGAMLALYVFDLALDLYAAVGLILLVGIAKKNAIILVHAAVRGRSEGRDAISAAIAACESRFRPVVMTSLTAIAGTLPITLGFGADAESRRPLGLVVLGGLMFSQVLTLFVVPMFYVILARAEQRFHGQGLRKTRIQVGEST